MVIQVRFRPKFKGGTLTQGDAPCKPAPYFGLKPGGRFDFGGSGSGGFCSGSGGFSSTGSGIPSLSRAFLAAGVFPYSTTIRFNRARDSLGLFNFPEYKFDR